MVTDSPAALVTRPAHRTSPHAVTGRHRPRRRHRFRLRPLQTTSTALVACAYLKHRQNIECNSSRGAPSCERVMRTHRNKTGRGGGGGRWLCWWLCWWLWQGQWRRIGWSVHVLFSGLHPLLLLLPSSVVFYSSSPVISTRSFFN